MRRFVPAFTLCLFLLLIIPTQAQDNQTSPDATAVRATVTNYIEAYYTGDARRMEQTLHPHYLKHMIHGNIPMRDKTGPQMVQEIRTNGVPGIPQAQRTEQVLVLDVAGTIASAKLVTPGWVDYVTLSKLDGEWKILSVVQRIDN
ncbi:MAG: nuclear transport factor 2 family protein [Candidatus Sulfotelmatobacter sp.]